MALGRSLFRQEAIEFQRGQREFGEIALLQPVSTKLETSNNQAVGPLNSAGARRVQ